MQNFRSLKVWERAHALTLDVYRLTRSFPKDELYGLTSQLRRACASIGLNLAEGGGYATDKARANATQIAIASSCEVEYALLLARDLGYVAEPMYVDLDARVGEVRKMLVGLAAHFRKAE